MVHHFQILICYFPFLPFLFSFSCTRPSTPSPRRRCCCCFCCSLGWLTIILSLHLAGRPNRARQGRPPPPPELPEKLPPPPPPSAVERAQEDVRKTTPSSAFDRQGGSWYDGHIIGGLDDSISCKCFTHSAWCVVISNCQSKRWA